MPAACVVPVFDNLCNLLRYTLQCRLQPAHLSGQLRHTRHQSLHLLTMFFNFLKLFAHNLCDVPFDAHTYEGVIESSSHFWVVGYN